MSLPSHTTFPPGGKGPDHWDDLECARCGDLATKSFGTEVDFCDSCADKFGQWLNGGW